MSDDDDFMMEDDEEVMLHEWSWSILYRVTIETCSLIGQ
jgi:hypothetical protein